MPDLWEERYKEIERREEEERARQQGLNEANPPKSRRQSLSDRPVLLSAILGAVGGSAGVAFGAILASCVLILALPADSGEGIAFLLVFYCLLMFPCGGILLGALPGALVGWLRLSRQRPLNPLVPLVAGSTFTFLITLVAAVMSVFYLIAYSQGA